MKHRLNLKNPVTYNEKLQWLKLYNRRDEYSSLVDKYAVKQVVADMIGPEYVIPTIGVWKNTKEIIWENLPPQFVLKTTNGGGSNGVIICKDKSSFDKDLAIKKLNWSLHHNIYNASREWSYKGVVPRIIAEPYIEDNETGELRDYKFFCFNGVVKALFVATERQKVGEDVKFDFYDAEFNHLPIQQGHKNAVVSPSCPKSFEKMKKLASQLSQGITHVRVDFYEVDGHPLFGEYTFYHFAGLIPFSPEEWDRIFGDWLQLPK